MAFGTVMLALWGLPANAQPAQTAPNAQAFLTSIVQQYPVVFSPGFRNDSSTLRVFYRIREVSSDDECRTSLSGDLGRFIGRKSDDAFDSGSGTADNKLHTNLNLPESYLSYYKLLSLPYQLDWSRVVSVKQDNRTKVNDSPGDKLATRAAFAMEFLRLHCDKTVQTGF